jgi:hypothetical protein
MTDIAMILDRLGKKLVADVTPKLEGDYAAGHVSMTGLMMVMAGEMWDGASERLVNEIKGMRALLDGQADVSAIKAAPSLKVSDLTVERDALARQLIALQAAVETRGDDASKALNARIWGHLMQTTMARMPSPPSFAPPED